MQIQALSNRVMIVLASVGACGCIAQAPAKQVEPKAMSEQAATIKLRIAKFEAQLSKDRDTSITRIQYKGQPAYLILSPCCDHFNYLYDPHGNAICAPSGGIAGAGDGQCSEAAGED
jgi:hypothetical protein